MTLFDRMYTEDHEQVVFCADRAAGLKAIIAIHDTTLGPALGGVRMRSYASEQEAITDALRLAQAMTFKAALAGLDYGGGKAVVIGDHTTTQREVLFRALGRAIESLAGRYIPTEDMGTTTADIERVRKESRFGVGRDEVFGGGGDPSPMTAWGIFCGLRACLEEVDASRTQKAVAELQARLVSPEEILFQQCDILAPCAAGAIFSRETIPHLRCRIIGGGANNQLLTDEDGDTFYQRDVLYAPDFAINAGGLINVADELGPGGYRRERAKAKTESIYPTLRTIFAEAKRRSVPPHRLAIALAQERIQAVRQLRRLNAGS
jgi:leucine dehydrogenase